MRFHVCWPFLPEKGDVGQWLLIMDGKYIWFHFKLKHCGVKKLGLNSNSIWFMFCFGNIIKKLENRNRKHLLEKKPKKLKAGLGSEYQVHGNQLSPSSFWQNSSPQIFSEGQKEK